MSETPKQNLFHIVFPLFHNIFQFVLYYFPIIFRSFLWHLYDKVVRFVYDIVVRFS